MKAFDLLENMGDLSDKVIMEAFELENMTVRKRKRKSIRLVVLAAVLSILLLGVTAYAAMDYLGIFQMLNGTRFALAPESAGFVETQAATGEAQGWNCRIVESLTDAADYMVTVGISGGDKYIVAPECSPEDSVYVIGLEGDQTLAEYAKEQGKTLLFVGATMEERERLGIAVEDSMPRNQSPSEMTILISGHKLDTSDVIETTCLVYAREDGKNDYEDVQRLHLPVTLTSAPSDESFKLEPVGSDEILGIKFLSVTASKSALGWMVEFQVEYPKEGLDDLKKMDCDELSSFEGGGFVFWDNAPTVCQWTKGQGEIKDTLTVHFYDWDNEVIGMMVFKKAA